MSNRRFDLARTQEEITMNGVHSKTLYDGGKGRKKKIGIGGPGTANVLQGGL